MHELTSPFILPPPSPMYPQEYWNGYPAVGVVECPPHLCVETVHNPLAPTYLQQNDWQALTEYCVRHTFLTTFASQQQIFVPKEYGRALQIGICSIPYADHNVGTTITTKGNLISGSNYIRAIQNQQAQIRLEAPGLFGEQEAIQEIAVANLLLTSGLRVSLPLGYRVLDPLALAEYIRNTGMFTPATEHRLLQSIERVSLRDRPVILFRLDTVPERMIYDDFFSAFPLIHGLYVHQAEISRHLEENTPTIHGYYRDELRESLEAFIHITWQVHHEETPDTWAVETVIQYLVDLEIETASRLHEYVQYQQLVHRGDFIPADFYSPKDVSWDLTRRDFENSHTVLNGKMILQEAVFLFEKLLTAYKNYRIIHADFDTNKTILYMQSRLAHLQ